MNNFTTISVSDFEMNPFILIGKDWMLVAAENGGKVNALTASWGGVGVLWNKNVCYIFIRESRYTKEFIDKSNTFSLSFFDHEQYKSTLSYMGRVSGRDEDKIKNSGLTVANTDGVPYFDEAKTVITCKKLACQPITKESFIDESIAACYADNDYHTMYVGEILSVLKR